MDSKKYKIGLLIGRFQPFHKGHLHLIKESFKYIDQMIIGLGSAGKIDQDNFLNYEIRKKILESVIKNEGLQEKISKIFPIKDNEDDNVWLRDSIKLADKFDVVIGNNEWTNGIFERAGYKVLRLGFYKRYLFEGVKIRKLIAENKDWEERVPFYIISFLHDFIDK